jgi:hypothetical protein
VTLYTPLDQVGQVQNLCRCCNRDFASLRAFDAHTVGDRLQDRTSWRPTPLRCLDQDELEKAGMELDVHGRWHFAPSDTEQDRFARLRAA